MCDATVTIERPENINSKEAYNMATLWAAWEIMNDDTSPTAGLSINERRALRRDKLKDLHRISKLRLAIDEIAQEYQVDMSRYKYLK